MMTVPAPVVDPSVGSDAYRQLLVELAGAGFEDHAMQSVAAAANLGIAFDAPMVFGRSSPGSIHCPGTPLATVLRLFQEQETVSNAEVDAIFSKGSLDVLERGCLLERTREGTSARVKLTAWRGLVIACDHAREEQDCVFEPNRSTARVEACLRPHRAGAKAVDVGTGSGALAMILRRQSRDLDLVAVDVTQRALDFTKYNFALNSLAPADLRLTDHSALELASGIDCVLWNMPSTYETAAQVGLGFGDAHEGPKTLRELYRSLSRCLRDRGYAALRHDMRTERLDRDGFVSEIEVTEGLHVLFMHIVPDENEARFFPPGVTFGGALVRRTSGPTRVSFLPVTAEERKHFSARRMWTSVLTMDGWNDLSRSAS